MCVRVCNVDTQPRVGTCLSASSVGGYNYIHISRKWNSTGLCPNIHPRLPQSSSGRPATAAQRRSLSRRTWARGLGLAEVRGSEQPFPQMPLTPASDLGTLAPSPFPSPMTSVCGPEVACGRGCRHFGFQWASVQRSWGQVRGGGAFPCPLCRAPSRAAGALLEQLLHHLLAVPFPCGAAELGHDSEPAVLWHPLSRAQSSWTRVICV